MAIPKPSSCANCVGYNWPCPTPQAGFVGATGSGRNGVLIVLESASEQDAAQGIPLVGAGGHQFNQLLSRGRMVKDDFRIANVLYCRPPNGVLVGVDYASAAIDSCAPNLDAEIQRMRPKCIVACGNVALRRLLPDCPVGIDDARGYVHEYVHHDGWKTWLIGTIHPNRILRGQTALTAVFVHDVQKATEVARDGFEYYDSSFALLDPTPADAMLWAQKAEQTIACRRVVHLSADIETPDKGSDEDELEDEETEDIRDASYTILRCGYAYHDTQTNKPAAMSIPWGGAYTAVHQRLLGAPVDKLWHNKSFDVPRVLADDVDLRGVMGDSMESWHVLNSDLRRSLGTVASFLCPTFRMWKHLASKAPAYYNMLDALAADICQIKIIEQLHVHGLYKVYDEQILQLDPIFTSMSAAGMPIDAAKRLEFAKVLTALQIKCRAEMQTAVPGNLRTLEPKEGYKSTPKDLDALRATLAADEQLVERLFEAQIVKRCSCCGLRDPKKDHFKSKPIRTCATCGKKWTVKHPHPSANVLEQNPCAGAAVVTTEEGVSRWVRVQPFVPSPKQILTYIFARGQKPEYEGRGDQKKPTTNVKAMKKLRAKYPSDPLYPLLMDDRKIGKLAGTYIGRAEQDDQGVWKIVGGFPVHRDGRVRTQFVNSPSTLRTACRAPNLHTLPR